MQTTLLSLAIAIILALVAALVAPFYIDWTSYRSLFEAEASRLAGIAVHVRGPIDARLLPTPRLQLRDIEFGGSGAMRARSLEIEFGLGQLMRGEWRASDLRLVGPQIKLDLDPFGSVAAPAFALNFDPDALSVDHLAIENGSVVIADVASGRTLSLDKVWFNGDLRSLAGPIKGEGAATVGGGLYPFRLASGRAVNGAIRLHLNIDPQDTPLNAEADGSLSLTSGKPQFEGTWSVSRPVGIASQGSGALVTQPWRIGGKLKATPASALMEQLEFQFGSDVQAVKLSGTADFKFGARPRLDAVLSAPQIDLDRLAGDDQAARSPPAVIIRRLAGAFGQAFRPEFPISVGIGIDVVTLGGSDLQGLRGDISTTAGGWTLDRFEFRAPGLSQIRLSGRLAVTDGNAEFSGPADIAASDASALAAWLEGRKNNGATPRPLRLRGDVALGPDRLSVDRLNANFERGSITGHIRFDFASATRAARIDAALSATELDLDAANDFTRALLAGSSLERPAEVKLALDIGRARFAGIDAGKTTARLEYDGGGLKVEQLVIADLGGANVAAHGDVALNPPRGTLTLDLDARDLSGIAAIVSRFAPEAAGRFRAAAPLLAPAKLTASLKLDDDAGGGHGWAKLTGSAGGIRIAFNAEGNVALPAIELASLRVQGQAEAADSSVLTTLLGLDRAFAVGKEPGALRLTISGNPLRELAVTTSLSGGGFTASATGNAQPAASGWPNGKFALNIERANLAPLAGTAAPLPLALTAQIALANGMATASDISAVLAGSHLRGSLTASLAVPTEVGGELKADSLDAGAMLTTLIGVPTPQKPWDWPSAPFTGGVMGKISGNISLAAMRANVASLGARELRGQLHIGGNAVALRNLSATLASGQLGGDVSFHSGDNGLAASALLTLNGADAAAFFPDRTRPPLGGKLSLNVTVEGTGRSPVALVGSLRGNGKLALSTGQFAGLDPRVFGVVTQAVDRGLPVDAGKITQIAGSALQSGQLTFDVTHADLDISAGQIRVANVQASGEGADLSLSGALDLTDGGLDARLVLTGAEQVAGSRPDLFIALRGPLAAPSKSLDVSALNSWLTLRAIDRQSKSLEQIEAKPVTPPPPAAPEPPAAAPAAAPKAVRPAAPLRDGRNAQQAPSLPAPIDILPAPASR